MMEHVLCAAGHTSSDMAYIRQGMPESRRSQLGVPDERVTLSVSCSPGDPGYASMHGMPGTRKCTAPPTIPNGTSGNGRADVC